MITPLGPLGDHHGRGGHAADCSGLADELGDEQVVEVESNRTGVEAGDLQQVFHQTLEAGDVGDQQVERGLGPLGHVVAAALHHLDAGSQRHQRGAQLVADVAGEAGIAFHARLQRGGHVVERVGQHAQVGVVGGLEAGVQPAAGDGLGGLGRVAQWADGSAGHQRPEQCAGQCGDEAGEDEAELHAVQRLGRVVQRDELEVAGVGDRQRHADDQHRLAADGGDHPRRNAFVDDLQLQRHRDVVGPELRRAADGPGAAVVDGEAGDAEGLQPLDGGVGRRVVGAELVLRHLRVAVRLLDAGLVALVHHAAAGEAVRGGGEEHAEEQRAEPEHQQDASAQAEPARLDAAPAFRQRSPAAGERRVDGERRCRADDGVPAVVTIAVGSRDPAR
jgi:hypothetical protein